MFTPSHYSHPLSLKHRLDVCSLVVAQQSVYFLLMAMGLQGIEFWSTVAEEEIDLAIAAAEAAESGQVPTVASKHYAKGTGGNL